LESRTNFMNQQLLRTGDKPLSFHGELLVDLHNAPRRQETGALTRGGKKARWHRIRIYRLAQTDSSVAATHAVGIGYRSDFVYRNGEVDAPIDIAFTCREDEIAVRLRAHDIEACFPPFPPNEQFQRKRQFLIELTRRYYLMLVSEALRQAGITDNPTSADVLLSKGENTHVEFKSSARWDLKQGRKNPDLEKVIVKTVAAFLNTEGGDLLLGVTDSGEVIGLQHDYQTIQKSDRDGYELFIHDLLLNACGKDCAPYYRISFGMVKGNEFCRVAIQASPRPVFIKEGSDENLYIRSGNSTRRLTTREALEYCRSRWPSN